MTIRAEILRDAEALTTGDRNRDYGEPRQNMARIAEIFNAMTGGSLDAREVALFHLATKLARLDHSRGHRDSYVDGAAYLAIAFEVSDAS